MLFFGKKSPEEKEAERLEKLRRHEGDRAFGGALITPVGTLALADICMVRLEPEGRLLSISSGFHKRHEIPYSALRGMAIGSESQIAKGESAITAEEMAEIVAGDAGQFLGPMKKSETARARWFIALDYEGEDGAPQRLLFIAYSMRGPYFSSAPLYASVQFQETLEDILQRQNALPEN